jgi:thioredoxin-related protein
MKIAFVLMVILFGANACYTGFPEPKSACTVSPPTDSDYGSAGQNGMTYYSSLDSAVKCAAVTGRKILVMFTGYNCLSDPEVVWEILREDDNRKLITEQYVFVVLYVDDKDSLKQFELAQISEVDSDTVFTVGQKNSALERYRCNQNSQPLYAIFDASLNLVGQMGFSRDPDEMESMLRRSIE